MDARLSIQFIALILVIKTRMEKNKHSRLRHLAARETMEAMETVSEVSATDRRSNIITETGPTQRDIVEHFGISL